MCRALKILCAASSPARLSQLKRAAVAASWELVGGATNVGELVRQVSDWQPDVVVLDSSLGEDAETIARAPKDTLRVVVVDLDTEVSPKDIQSAILALPRPGGPVKI
ncbi:MAG TPA: hypothetical protein VF660_09990 [Actinomycetota bacterium]